jgi:PleD family two-component response regulator
MVPDRSVRPGGHAVTASLGVATGTDGVDAIPARADEGLSKAKGAGRDRVGCRDGRTEGMVLTEGEVTP